MLYNRSGLYRSGRSENGTSCNMEERGTTFEGKLRTAARKDGARLKSGQAAGGGNKFLAKLCPYRPAH